MGGGLADPPRMACEELPSRARRLKPSGGAETCGAVSPVQHIAAPADLKSGH